MSEVVKLHKCPICGTQFTSKEYIPFCSKRCADVDLGRWFNGAYTVESQDLDDTEIEELNKALTNADKSAE